MSEWIKSNSQLLREILSTLTTDLIAMDTHVVCGDERFEDNHPAGIHGPLKQSVSHLWDVHVGLIGGGDQI